MSEKEMYRGIRKTSWLLMLCCMIVCVAVTKELKYTIAGVAIGTLTGVMGFQSIIRMSEKIDGSQTNLSLPAFSHYARRYVLYALIFGISAYLGVNILVMLIGFTAHKAAIVLYVWIHRKEAE